MNWDNLRVFLIEEMKKLTICAESHNYKEKKTKRQMTSMRHKNVGLNNIVMLG